MVIRSLEGKSILSLILMNKLNVESIVDFGTIFKNQATFVARWKDQFQQ